MKTVLRSPMKALTLVAVALAGAFQGAAAQTPVPLSPLWSFTYDAPPGKPLGKVQFGVGPTGTAVVVFKDDTNLQVLVLSSRGLKIAEGSVSGPLQLARVGAKRFMLQRDFTLIAYGFANGGIFPISSLELFADDNPSDEFTDRTFSTSLLELNQSPIMTFDFNNNYTKCKITRYRE